MDAWNGKGENEKEIENGNVSSYNDTFQALELVLVLLVERIRDLATRKRCGLLKQKLITDF